MESVEQLGRRITSARDLRTIVKTMKALSAASIRQYEEATAALAQYERTVRRGLDVVLDPALDSAALHAPRVPGRSGVIVFGSDHGLCGRFNHEVARIAAQRVGRWAEAGRQPVVLAVGARAVAALQDASVDPEEGPSLPNSAPQITQAVKALLLRIDRWTGRGRVTEVHLVHNRHGRGLKHGPRGFRLWPVDLGRLRRQRERDWPSRTLPTYSMEQSALTSRLLRQFLFVSLFRAYAESLASEHSSRLQAMQSAQKNLDDRLGELTVSFRRARQRAITSELLDVVSGFEASTGNGEAETGT